MINYFNFDISLITGSDIFIWITIKSHNLINSYIDFLKEKKAVTVNFESVLWQGNFATFEEVLALQKLLKKMQKIKLRVKKVTQYHLCFNFIFNIFNSVLSAVFPKGDCSNNLFMFSLQFLSI